MSVGTAGSKEDFPYQAPLPSTTPSRPPPHTGCPLTPSNQLPPRTMTRARGKRETSDTFGRIVNSMSHVVGTVNECDESARDRRRMKSECGRRDKHERRDRDGV